MQSLSKDAIIGGAILSFFKSVVPYSPSRLFITNFKIQTQHFVLCLLISVFCLLYLPCTAVAGTEAVTVGWDASPSAVAGYEFCYGTSSGSYDHVVDVGNHTSCSISGLEAGTTYYFAVKAYTAEGLSSELSVELAYTVPVKNLIASPDFATIYEDAEDGTTRGWAVYDKSPAGASIKNVYDSGRNSRVIQLSGSGVNNGYRLRNSDGSKWQNAEQFILQWSMKYSESFVIYIDVETTAGHRYLRYTPVDYDNLAVAKTYADFGIGSDAVDGSWHTFVRDLQADIEAAFPGTTILEVNGFLIRGSGMVDDIMLY
jgi:hypothetical protein